MQALLRDFRPRPWPSAIAGIGVLVLLCLGTWQVTRLFEKREINGLRASRLAMAEAPLPAALPDPSSWEFRRVVATGRLRHERELYLPCRSQRGNEGTCVLVPLVRDEGPPVLVNRVRWVDTRRTPESLASPSAWAAGRRAGSLRAGGTQPRFTRTGGPSSRTRGTSTQVPSLPRWERQGR